ncbi:hypothetical protein ACEUZ9_000309 [Paracoccus litorisediminis]|uniref:hypothetical protein n=1 Tax=Paracoccus litorisediminis TaxID=2006130 RepID=UPI00372FE939
MAGLNLTINILNMALWESQPVLRWTSFLSIAFALMSFMIVWGSKKFQAYDPRRALRE